LNKKKKERMRENGMKKMTLMMKRR